jgi:hypothetical protein
MLLSNSFWNPPNNFWITEELFRLSWQYYDNSKCTKTILPIIEPLSVLPYGSGILQTSPRHLHGE